jgi:hypothetical protein
VIFSMEGVFAAIAGWAALGETLSTRALVGCALMLAGLLACQLLPASRSRANGETGETHAETNAQTIAAKQSVESA